MANWATILIGSRYITPNGLVLNEIFSKYCRSVKSQEIFSKFDWLMEKSRTFPLAKKFLTILPNQVRAHLRAGGPEAARSAPFI